MDATADAGGGASRKRRRAQAISPAETPLTVLVADDEELIRRALSRLLSARGHHVHVAVDAPEAIALLQAHDFDVLLIDRRMPGGGESVVKALDTHPGFTGRAFLMTGALGADPTREFDRDVKLITKPFDFAAMVAEVEGGPG